MIVVWGTVGYQIIQGLNPSLPETTTNLNLVSTNFRIQSKVDTFSIQKQNRDPFLGIVYNKPSVKKEKIKLRSIQWMPITYKGLIRGANKKQDVYIIEFDSKQSLVKIGQTIDGVTLVRGTKNKIVLMYKGQTKSISRV